MQDDRRHEPRRVLPLLDYGVHPPSLRGRRVASIAILIAALAWSAEVLRQVHESDDGGPPAGALCMAMPSFGLLICAGVAWPTKPRE